LPAARFGKTLDSAGIGLRTESTPPAPIAAPVAANHCRSTVLDYQWPADAHKEFSKRSFHGREEIHTMRQGLKVWVATAFSMVLLCAPGVCSATSCTTQAALLPQDRDALTAAGGRLAVAVAEQDYAQLKAALLPAAATEWEGIRGVVESAAPLLKGAQIQLRNLYLLDAASLTAPSDTQFFCSNVSGSLTVTLTMRTLPPGRYAVVLADAASGAQSGQLGFILAWGTDGATPGWRLGGLTVSPGSFEGHDGVWYWARARELARGDQGKIDSWSAWYTYEAARTLLVPVNFLSSPNLEKLGQEQAQIKNPPQNAFPYSVPDGTRTWKIQSLALDATLLHADLGITYESTGVTDPAAVRTEAMAVMSALLKAQPGLRANFHGLWAYAVRDGKRTPVIELPMAQIP